MSISHNSEMCAYKRICAYTRNAPNNARVVRYYVESKVDGTLLSKINISSRAARAGCLVQVRSISHKSYGLAGFDLG